VGAVLADAPVKVALQAAAEACAKPVTYNRFLSDSQEKSRKPEQLKSMSEELTRLKRRTNPSTLNA
jgi:N6-adenosine-specific RNA methylase IME4